MSKLRVNNIYDKAGTGAPTLPAGIEVTGIATVSSAVSIGGTSVMTAIDGKASPGKAIALAMVFG